LSYFTTSIAVVAGLCLASAILYLFIGVRRAADRTLDILFASFALFYALAIMSARSAYLADDPGGFAAASRISAVFAAAGFVSFLWFVATYTKVRPVAFLWVVTTAFGIYGFAAMLSDGLVVNITEGVESITFPWGETILMFQTGEPPLLPLVVGFLFVLIVYVAVADVQQFRRGEREAAIALAIGVGWFAFTLIQESLVLLGGFDFVVLSDFGFLGFVIAMTLGMVNTAIAAEARMIDYRDNLEAMVEARSAELEDVQAQLLAQAEEHATTAERTRLARELHDVVTQLLFSINLVAGSLPRLWRQDPEMAERSTAELQRLTRGALAEMRLLLRELRPHTIAETDLATLITQLSDGLAARHDIPATVHTDIDGTLPPDVHVALYRITQEAISNIAKHAHASTILVDLAGSDSRVALSVIDDGYGFDISAVPTGSMGLDIMNERAEEIGAVLTISSDRDAGTTVAVQWQARTPVEHA
jgi:signal transduction histidine kinase